MKYIKNKKIILTVLIIIFLFLLLFNYLNIKDFKLKDFFVFGTKTEAQLPKNNIKQKSNSANKENNLNRKENLEKSKDKKTLTVEKIALISEIQDPFKKKNDKSSKREKKQNNSLVLLEENIIENDLKKAVKIKSEQSKKQENIITTKSIKTKKNKNENQKEKQLKTIKNINFPFKMIGIIKNKNEAAVLFLYQGEKIVKKEDQKIDLFKIEEINNKNIVLSYKKQKRILKLWEDSNEN